MTAQPTTMNPHVTAAAINDARDAEAEAAAATAEARAAARRTAAAAPSQRRHHFTETVAWGVAAEAWADAAASAARRSGDHPEAAACATGAEQARAFAKGHIRLAAKAARR